MGVHTNQMTTPSNPFQLVYDELWSMLEEDIRFTVKEGNKIKFTGTREPIKTNHTTSDYPEVMLVPESGTGNLCNTSTTSMCVRQYSWVISAGDFRYEKISHLEWAIYAGMLAWMYRLKTLTWEDVEFVKCANIVSANLDQIEQQRTRGIPGWIAVWTISVDMHFSNELIRGTNLP